VDLNEPNKSLKLVISYISLYVIWMLYMDALKQ